MFKKKFFQVEKVHKFKNVSELRAFTVMVSNRGTSVADPDHFDADPDPTSEKKPNADPIILHIKFCNKIFMLKNGL
jgi:hypothetical protein